MSSRPVYPYSIIPGGILTPAELRRHMDADHLVSAHYRNFDVGRTRVVRLHRSVRGYVSYRRAGRIYWTTRRLFLAKGELALTDGVHIARTRCGNRVVEDRKLIPPEELGRDPEEAIVTRVFDKPEPPVVPASLVPDTYMQVPPSPPMQVPPSPPMQVPPSPPTLPPLLPPYTSTAPPGAIPPAPPFFVLPTEAAPPLNRPHIGGDPPPTATTPVPEPPTILLLVSGATAIIVCLRRRSGG